MITGESSSPQGPVAHHVVSRQLSLSRYLRTAGIASFVVGVLILAFSIFSIVRTGSVLALPALVAGLLALWAGDHVLAMAALLRQDREVSLSAQGMSGVLLPMGRLSRKGVRIVYRSPVLGIVKAEMPTGGVPWSALTLAAWWPERGRSGSGTAIVQPRGMSGAALGGLLFFEHAYSMATEQVCQLASAALERGGHVEFCLIGVTPASQFEFPRHARRVKLGNWLRVERGFTPDEIRSVVKAISTQGT